ncbi:MAG: DUF2312 domain-containing protein [Hyphomicrobium sp.]|jgi:uncharacterized protein (UPF0335 family)
MAKNKTYPDVSGGGNAASVAGAQLRAFIERVERMNEEKKAVSDDIREIFAEAKGNGFDPKIMRIIIRRRAMDAHARAEQDALVETYSHSLGMASPADAETDEAE